MILNFGAPQASVARVWLNSGQKLTLRIVEQLLTMGQARNIVLPPPRPSRPVSLSAAFCMLSTLLY